jgi:hypothetical protein
LIVKDRDMALPSVASEDDRPPTASASSAIFKALVALTLFALAFVLFLTAPLALIVAVCAGLVGYDRWRARARQPTRHTPAAPVRTPRGPVDEIDASFRFGGQVGERE